MAHRLKDEITQLHAEVCSALADANRIMILYTLNEGRANVGSMAETLEIPQPTISRHLKVLRERGMVTATRDGQQVYYTLTDKRVIDALDLMRSLMADRLSNQASLMENQE